MKIIRLSNIDHDVYRLQNKVDRIESDLKDFKKEIKDDFKNIKKDMESINKTIDKLNIGERRFWQSQTIFNSLQRKMERLENMEDEWKNFKSTIEDDLKEIVEKKIRAKIKPV